MQINVSSPDCFPGFLHLLLDTSMTEKHLIPSALCLWEDTSVSADTELKKKIRNQDRHLKPTFTKHV